MTDKEVSNLSRRDLLVFLLEARTENEALVEEREKLLENIRELEAKLQNTKSETGSADLQATVLLQEARAVYPRVQLAEAGAVISL